MRSRSILTTLATTVALLATGCGATSPFVPREAFTERVNDFATTNGELAKTLAPTLESVRADLRVRMLGVHLVRWMEHEKIRVEGIRTGQDVSGYEALSFFPQSTMLCDPRGVHARMASRQGQLVSISSRMLEVTGTPPDGIPALVDALGKSYAISVPEPVDVAALEADCARDLKAYVETVYPSELVPSQYESFVTIQAVMGLYEVFREIVTPVFEAGLKEVDSARRAAAIRKFLAAPEQQAMVADLIEKQGNLLEQAAVEERHWRTKAFVDAYRAADWSSVVSGAFAASPACQGFVNSPGSALDKSSGLFRDCYAALWKTLSTAASPTLEAAGAYDVSADRVPPHLTKRLKSINGKLAEIAKGEIDSELARLLFATAMRMTAVAESAKKMFDDKENRRRIREALDRVTESIGAA